MTGRPDTNELITTARRVCTPPQLAVVELYEAGFGYRVIARRLGISVTTVRDRLDRAWDRIDQELKKEADCG